MKMVDTFYVLIIIGNVEINEETTYLASDDKFTNDVREALKAANRTTALELKHNYEVCNNHSYESDLKIVPLNITYEW